MNFTRGKEIIESVGREFTKDFNVNESLFLAYKSVYENLINGLDKNAKSKGLLIIGSIGVGKTLMMKVYQKMFLGSKRAFKMIKGASLQDLLEVNSIFEIKQAYGYDLKMDLYIDDIGINNPDFKRYGNSTNVIAEILMERYELFIDEGFKTHLSSNLLARLENNPNNIPTIETLYTNRVFDRIKEMCELIVIDGKSLRK